MWSYMLSLPRVTRNSTDITTEKATVPNTTNVSPFPAMPSTSVPGRLCTLLIVADRRTLRYPQVLRID